MTGEDKVTRSSEASGPGERGNVGALQRSRGPQKHVWEAKCGARFGRGN